MERERMTDIARQYHMRVEERPEAVDKRAKCKALAPTARLRSGLNGPDLNGPQIGPRSASGMWYNLYYVNQCPKL